MIRLRTIFGVRLWTRLFLLILGVVVITWIVVGLALFLLGSARQTVDRFVLDDVPSVIQTAHLSALTARLVLESNQLLRATTPQSNLLETNLRATLSEIENIISDRPRLSIDTKTLTAFREKINAVLIRLDMTRQANARVVQNAETLRWLHVDIEDEATALVADFAFNVNTLTGELARAVSQTERIAAAKRLRQDQSQQNLFANIESEASAAAILGVQAAVALELPQLDRIEASIADSLSRIAELIGQLPVAAENASLLQSIADLDRLLLYDRGLIEARRNWLFHRSVLDTALETLFDQLQSLLGEMSQATDVQSQTLKSRATSFVDFVSSSMRALVILTLLSGAAGIAILFLYIRPSIIRPLRELTRAMRKISAGEPPTLPDMSKKGRELSELAAAVTAFEDAVAGRERAIKQLKDTQIELVQTAKLAALGSMSAGLAHELNQPLGAIRHRYHLAKRALAKKQLQSTSDQLDKVANLVDRTEAIIKRLRRFGQTTDIMNVSIRLGPSIDGAVTLLSSRLRENQIKVNLENGVRDVIVSADAVLLEQVIVNLLSNSIDAIAELGEPGVITIDGEATKTGTVQFCIVDTGAGLGELDGTKVFDPFFTTKDPSKGMGLGLSISYNMMSQMGGSLALIPSPNGGAQAIASLQVGVSNEG